MSKIIQLKYLIIFLAGLYLGMLYAPNVHAQTTDTTAASGAHLRVASNTLEDKLNVKVFPGNKSMKYVKIFDIIGNEVASIDLAGKSGSLTFNVDASRLENGIYFCNLYSEKGIIQTNKVYWSR